MVRLKLLSWLLLMSMVMHALPAFAAITATSNKCKFDDSAGSSTVACTMPGNTTAGNFLAVCVVGEDVNTATFQSVSDGTTSGTKRVFATNDAEGIAIFDIQNITAQTTPTITVTFSTGLIYRGIIVQEFSGVATSGAYDVSAGNAQDGVSTSTDAVTSSSTSTTAQANEVLIGCVERTGGAGTVFTQGTSYTLIDSNTANTKQSMEYRVVSSTGAYSATFTSSAAANVQTLISTYKEAAADTPAMRRGFGVPGMNSYGVGGPLP